jgi:hypothetical protein
MEQVANLEMAILAEIKGDPVLTDPHNYLA